MNNLNQIGLALFHYANKNGDFPPAYTTDAMGEPLHSWRTLILPYMERNDVYELIDLGKPWDDPVNAKAREKLIEVYVCPASRAPSRTTYLAVVTSDSLMHPTTPRPVSDTTVENEPSWIVLEVPTDHAVHWMAPVDADEQTVLGIGPNSKLAHKGGMLVVKSDRSVQFVDAEMPAAERLAAIKFSGSDEPPDESKEPE